MTSLSVGITVQSRERRGSRPRQKVPKTNLKGSRGGAGSQGHYTILDHAALLCADGKSVLLDEGEGLAARRPHRRGAAHPRLGPRVGPAHLARRQKDGPRQNFNERLPPSLPHVKNAFEYIPSRMHASSSSGPAKILRLGGWDSLTFSARL